MACLLTLHSPFLQVFIFNLLEDHKFINFKPVMDNYLENHFSAVLVYR